MTHLQRAGLVGCLYDGSKPQCEWPLPSLPNVETTPTHTWSMSLCSFSPSSKSRPVINWSFTDTFSSLRLFYFFPHFDRSR